MCGNLHNVLTGVGVGSCEPGDKSLVDLRRLLPSSTSPSVEHIRQACSTVLEWEGKADQLHGDADSLRSTQANNADAAPARWRGDGGNCVDVR